ncbi:MAG TPA: PIN domain-containing protein [Candidatus Limnocylindrales bacterium]|nr:PIN domain-containing protein [Candidatus Limnocylindrales bacterium]
MKHRIFLDTNVFIFAFEFPDSNSNTIIEMLNDGKIEVIISERVIKEVYRYFKKYHDKKFADSFRNYLYKACRIILARDVKAAMKKYRGQIKEKDLEQLAVVKKYGIKYIISLDRDFIGQEEYRKSRQFVEQIYGESKESDF